jgi:hypothetical protein
MVNMELTREQEAQLVYTLEQDPDQWLVLLTLHIASQGRDSQDLRQGLLENTEKWQSLTRDVKNWGFGDLVDRACGQTPQWNAQISQLLGDPGQANLLSFYLKSLIAFKTRRVTDVGARAQTRQRIYTVLAAIANDALASLEKFRHAAEMLSSGKPLTPQARAYYEAAHLESASQIAALLGVSVQLREAKQASDVRQLKQFIQHNLLNPAEAKIPVLTGADKKQALEKAASYRRLMQAVEINFE